MSAAVGVVVFGHVSDVGDVHDMGDCAGSRVCFSGFCLERAHRGLDPSAKEICGEERAEVPDMRVVVDGWAAGVERDGVRVLWGE